jgi:regulator of protease activity HflC (stomatin/prohibitin superfamily)
MPTRREFQFSEGSLSKRLFGRKDGSVSPAKIILAGIIIALVVFFLVAGFVNVPAGHKAVIVTAPMGPDRVEIEEGWHWNPYYALCNIEIIRYNTQTRDMSSQTGSTLTVRSSDNLDIGMDVSLVWRMEADKVADIRIERGQITDLVDRYLRNVPRNVASNYTGEYIGGEGRMVVEEETRVTLVVELGVYDVRVEDFLIRSIDLPATLDIAIEEKKAAEQRVITAEFNRNVTVINADAERLQAILEAEGIRNATIIKANGTAEAVRMVMEQMKLSDPGLVNTTEAYLTLLYIQALTNPDSNIQYIIITDGGNPIIIQPQPGP